MTGIDESGAPSDRGLRALAAAADAGSLTGAAERLGTGQPAISHAIRRLEDQLGTRLLHRSRTGVRPTDAGAELLAVIAPAFEEIDRAVARTRDGGVDPTVTLSVSTSLASWWLLPRIPDFKRRHPDASLRLVTTDSDANVDPATVDLWIPLGIVDRPDLATTMLCAEALIPVAAPRVAAHYWDRPPEALLEAPLLHLEERYTPRFDWPRWFESQGVTVDGRLPGDRSNDYSLVLQAALDGQGVALGWRHIVSDLLDEGRLVPLAPAVVTDQPFVILHGPDGRLPPGAEALRRWLVASMSGSVPDS